jgi:hypothetical protein
MSPDVHLRAHPHTIGKSPAESITNNRFRLPVSITGRHVDEVYPTVDRLSECGHRLVTTRRAPNLAKPAAADGQSANRPETPECPDFHPSEGSGADNCPVYVLDVDSVITEIHGDG